MGIVTDKLIALVRAQVAKHGTVVWYDPDGAYEHAATALTPDQVGAAHIFRHTPREGFFALRYEIEQHWGRLDLNAAPRLLIYVPLAQSKAFHALIEYEVGGVVMQPDQSPPECNSALPAVARAALESIFPDARLAQILDETAAGKLSLAELDQIAERGADAQTGTLAVVFGTGNATEVMLRFLSDEALDAKITERGALHDVAKVFTDALGIDFTSAPDPQGLRARSARQVLATDFFESVGEGLTSPIPLAKSPVARAAAVELARQWRNRRDSAPAYIKWAGQIQTELSLSAIEIGVDALARSETFPAAETRLQVLIEEALLKRVSTPFLDLVRTRIGGFWSIQKPEIKTRWEVILNAGRVLQEAGRIETALKGKQWTASKLFAEYVYGENAWCGLDTAHRHLERDVHRYDLNPEQHASLQRLIAQASAQYAAMINRLAELFVPAYKDEDFTLADVQLQADIYRSFVAERIRKGRVAYILVDAFRFEMAREFVSLLTSAEPGWGVQITPALATPPTITDVGMAALMPGAEDGITLTFERGALVPQIGGKAVRTAKARMERIKTAVGAEIVETTLDEIAPLRKPALSRKLAEAQVVVVTASDDIDGLGENMPQKARRSLDDVFSLLRRGLSALAAAGIPEIVVTADHGFILADRLDDGQKIDAPGGDQASLLKRRVWVGVGGDSHPSTMRTPLSAFGIGGKLELVTPVGVAAFKVQGGNSEYFHGGLALQEVVIPVLVVSPIGAVAEAPPALKWNLTLGSAKITSPFVSVAIDAVASELWSFEPPLVRIELRSGGQAVSVPVSATYGFDDATKDVRLRISDTATRSIETNTVTVQLTEKSIAATDVCLLNAVTGAVLANILNIPVSLNLFE
jgi:hypothetical protein